MGKPANKEAQSRQRLPIGAQVRPGEGVHFRVWAPEHSSVEVVFEGEAKERIASAELVREDAEFFSALVPNARPLDLYRYRLSGNGMLLPDLGSRFQPAGPEGPSQVIDPSSFPWTDNEWRGVKIEGQVIYEMHIGTFTAEGTWETAAEQLPELAELGVTIVELMPVGEFAGKFGWGYDGVLIFAPTRLYGVPDDMRGFVDRAHAAGIGVILDVVYNHLGPRSNYAQNYSPYFFSSRYKTDWGQALNFDNEHSKPVRDYFAANGEYWIREFHLDGLRIDATQDVFDSSPEHILGVITRRCREAGGSRSVIIVAENEPQHVRLVRPLEHGGLGMDALWNDDFHHSAIVALTGKREAYYRDYSGKPQEFISAAKYGYLYQGQWYEWQQKRRGTPSYGVKPASFVNFLQNHDQIANSTCGLRAHLVSSSGTYRALTALMLLMPGTPMLFQGQEFASSQPFLYFADHDSELADMVRRGRREFLAQFPSIASEEVQSMLAVPSDPATFMRCKLDLSERSAHSHIYQMHKDLLALRREDPVFQAQKRAALDGAVLGTDAFLLRFFDPAEKGDDRVLLVNLGVDLRLTPSPEPLLAPPEGRNWRILWSSEDLHYGGCGIAPFSSDDTAVLSGRSALVLAPAFGEEDSSQP